LSPRLACAAGLKPFLPPGVLTLIFHLSVFAVGVKGIFSWFISFRNYPYRKISTWIFKVSEIGMGKQTRNLYLFEDFTLDISRKCLWRTGNLVSLTPKALETLLVLIKYRKNVVEKDTLLSEVWADTFVEEATLAQNISTLRRVLGSRPDKPFIETIPRRGYRFVMEVREITTAEDAAQAPGENLVQLKKYEKEKVFAARPLHFPESEADNIALVSVIVQATVSAAGNYIFSITRRGNDWVLQMRQIEY
jgi:DNA-binding winged helix-turn-helix (wHTH) protein